MEVAMVLMFQSLFMSSLPPGTPVFSLADCATKCFYQRNCSSLFYDKNSKTCQLTSELFKKENLEMTTQDVSYFVWTRDDCNNGYTWRRDLNICYKLYTAKKTWADVNQTCYQEDSHLVNVNSAGINDLINRISRRYSESIWLGASVPNGVYNWTWTDSSAMDVVFWDKDQPNGHVERCLVVWTGANFPNTRWHDYLCHYHFPFVCQRPMKQLCATALP